MAGKIPPLSNKKLEERFENIKPVLRFLEKESGEKYRSLDEGKLYYIEDVNLRNMSFRWFPKAKKIASDINQEHYKIINTLHESLFSSLFEPTIKEVLAQIPEEDLEKTVAFETIPFSYEKTRENFFEFCGQGYIVAKTKLYGKKE